MSQYWQGGQKGADVARNMELHTEPYHLSMRHGCRHPWACVPGCASPETSASLLGGPREPGLTARLTRAVSSPPTGQRSSRPLLSPVRAARRWRARGEAGGEGAPGGHFSLQRSLPRSRPPAWAPPAGPHPPPPTRGSPRLGEAQPPGMLRGRRAPAPVT